LLDTFNSYNVTLTRGVYELGNLDVEDTDIKQQLVRIRKGNREYILPISERACKWIVFYLAKLRPQLATITSDSALFLSDKRFL
jgi:integrase/recombinase XerD